MKVTPKVFPRVATASHAKLLGWVRMATPKATSEDSGKSVAPANAEKNSSTKGDSGREEPMIRT